MNQISPGLFAGSYYRSQLEMEQPHASMHA